MFTPSPEIIENANSLGLKLLPAAPFAFPSDISSTIFEREYVIANGKSKRDAEFRSGRLAAECSLSQIDIFGEVGVADDRSPIWPDGSIGSISHSDAFVWSIASLKSDMNSVGIDTEPVADASTLHHLKEVILQPHEEQLATQAGHDESTAFTTIFSAKESFYKCVYQIIPVFFGFHDVELKSMDNETMLLQLTSDCPPELRGIAAIPVEYIVTDNNVFTACWSRATR